MAELENSLPTRALDALIDSPDAVDWLAAATDARLDEGAAVKLLARRELAAEAVTAIAKNRRLARHRALLPLIVAHPRTPRHLSLPLLRRLYVFEMMRISLSPAVVADLRVAADKQIVARLETVSLGEKTSLAKQASGRVARALLNDAEARVIASALDNPRLSEESIAEALQRESSSALARLVVEHEKWRLRPALQEALLTHAEADEPLLRRAAWFASASVLMRTLRRDDVSDERKELFAERLRLLRLSEHME